MCIRDRDAVNRIGNIEEIVAATLVKMSGDVEGLMLFLFNMEFANTLLEKLLGKRFSSFEELDDLAYSALEEVGNIEMCIRDRYWQKARMSWRCAL